MHAVWAAALLATAAARTYGPEKLPEVADAADPLVDALSVVPKLIVDLRYATSNNFAGRPLYPKDTDCLLRRSVAERLARAARTLAKEHLRLVAWDCLRSPEAQLALWKAHPQPGAVAEPGRGSPHERRGGARRAGRGTARHRSPTTIRARSAFRRGRRAPGWPRPPADCARSPRRSARASRDRRWPRMPCHEARRMARARDRGRAPPARWEAPLRR